LWRRKKLAERLLTAAMRHFGKYRTQPILKWRMLGDTARVLDCPFTNQWDRFPGWWMGLAFSKTGQIGQPIVEQPIEQLGRGPGRGL